MRSYSEASLVGRSQLCHLYHLSSARTLQYTYRVCNMYPPLLQRILFDGYCSCDSFHICPVADEASPEWNSVITFLNFTEYIKILA
jgi:hypothetical protein